VLLYLLVLVLVVVLGRFLIVRSGLDLADGSSADDATTTRRIGGL
jgi:hypothetical protein